MYREFKGAPIFDNNVKRSHVNIVDKEHNDVIILYKKGTPNGPPCKGKTDKYICQHLQTHHHVIGKTHKCICQLFATNQKSE